MYAGSTHGIVQYMGHGFTNPLCLL